MTDQTISERLDVLLEAIRVKPRMSGILLIAITLFGLLLRTYRLDHLSFWVDEGFSAKLASANLSVWLKDVHPPLYYALLSMWQTRYHSDWWLRLLSVMFGVATIPVVYSLGKRLFTDKTGLWSAAFVSVLHIHVTYSQEARMYSLMVLLFACAFQGLVLGARERQVVGWLVYTASAALLVYTQALGCLYVLSLAVLFPVVTAGSRSLKIWRSWFLANSAVALLFSPYVFIYVQRVRGVAEHFWIPPGSPEPPIFTTLFFSTVSPIPPLSEMLAHQLEIHLSPFLGQWIWFVPVLVALGLGIARATAERRWAAASLLVAYTVPIVLLSAISVVIRPVLIPRVLLPTVVPMALMLGSLAASAVRPVWRNTGLVAVLIVLLIADGYAFRYGVKEEWRQASYYLQEKARASDIVLINLGIGRFLIDRYDSQGVLRQVPKLAIDEVVGRCGPDKVPVCLEEALRAYPSGQTVLVVEGHRLEEVRTSAEIWLASHLKSQERTEMIGVSIDRAVLAY